MGSIAVGLVLPESNGQVDASSENWDSQEIAQVISEIAVGMEWWASLDLRANLSFVYDNPMGATIPTEMNPDGSLEYEFTRPLGGHGVAYVDVLYLDNSLRVVRGHRGTFFVFSRLQNE